MVSSFDFWGNGDSNHLLLLHHEIDEYEKREAINGYCPRLFLIPRLFSRLFSKFIETTDYAEGRG